ncbi:MAG: hypothetical protein CVT49_07450 [candidate division Zixibacteria bacterium HGW-Zixibacteria-1]|nr:MAG: hypothetical protein CVT49_07450 [candidate division Zixibacteria bacterium HGW-Zixibacteria-1]
MANIITSSISILPFYADIPGILLNNSDFLKRRVSGLIYYLIRHIYMKNIEIADYSILFVADRFEVLQ